MPYNYYQSEEEKRRQGGPSGTNPATAGARVPEVPVQTTTTQEKKAAAPPATPNVGFNQDPDTGNGGGGGTGGVLPPGKGGNPGGTTGGSNGESGNWGLGEGEGGYTSPEGGLFDYYRQKMASTGMSPAAQAALASTTLTPIQQQQAASLDQMKRFRAATGNDAGIYAGISELGRNAGDQMADQRRKNLLTNEEIARQDQKEGAAGGLNLYGQTQAEAMEYLRMLGNILGREDFINTSGSSSGSGVGISWNPGGSSI